MVCMNTCSLEDFPDFDVTVSHPAADHLGKQKMTSVPDSQPISARQPAQSRKIKLAPPVSHRNARSEHRDSDAGSIASSVGDGELELPENQVHNSYRWDKLVPQGGSGDDKSSIESIKDNSSVKDNVTDTSNGSTAHEDRTEHDAVFKRTPSHARYKIFPDKELVPGTPGHPHFSLPRGEPDIQPNLPSPKTLPLSVLIQYHKQQQDSNVMTHSPEDPSPETTPDDSILSTVSSESHTSPSGVDLADKPQHLASISSPPLSQPGKHDRQSLLNREKSTSSVHTRSSLKIYNSIPSTPSLDQSLAGRNSARNSILIPLEYFTSSGANGHHFDVNEGSFGEDGRASLEGSDSPELATKRPGLLPGNTEIPSTKLSTSGFDMRHALPSPVVPFNSGNCLESQSSGQELVQSGTPSEVSRHDSRNASHGASLPVTSKAPNVKYDALPDEVVGIEWLPSSEKCSGQVADAAVRNATATTFSEHGDECESNARQSVCTIDAILEEFEQIASLSMDSSPRLRTYSSSNEPQTTTEALHKDMSALDRMAQTARLKPEHQVGSDYLEATPKRHDGKQLEVGQAHENLNPTAVSVLVGKEFELVDKLSLDPRSHTSHLAGRTVFGIEGGEVRKGWANDGALEDERALIARLEELSHSISVGHAETCPVEYIPKVLPDQAHVPGKGNSKKSTIASTHSVTKTTIQEDTSKAPTEMLVSSKGNFDDCVEGNILNHAVTKYGDENLHKHGKDDSRDIGWSSPPSEIIKKPERRGLNSIQKPVEPRADASVRPAAEIMVKHNFPDSPLLPATQPFQEPSPPGKTRSEHLFINTKHAELWLLEDESDALTPKLSSQGKSSFSHAKSDHDFAGSGHSEQSRILHHKSSQQTASPRRYMSCSRWKICPTTPVHTSSPAQLGTSASMKESGLNLA